MSDKTRKIRLNDWWKQFLTGVMGTAIGVGLTFAVSNLVDNNKKAQVQRQTATMAVYDIDEIIRELREDLQRDDALFPMAMYLSNHTDKLDVVSLDSLRQAFVYLMEDITTMPDWATDTKEKAFSSSMDAWQNLENTQFYDNVQKCYLKRAELLRVVKKDEVFRKPITDAYVDEFIQRAGIDEMEYDGSLSEKAFRRLMKQAYEKPETVRYLRRYMLRSRVLNEYIDELTRLNQENKFLMQLSDEEMEAYIQKNVQKTKSATPALLVGCWDAQMNEALQTFEFKADHSLDITTVMTAFMANLEAGEGDAELQTKVPISYRQGGEWVLEGDSLCFVCHPGEGEILLIDLDLDSLPESAQEKGRQWMEACREEINAYIQSSEQSVQKCAVSFDLTGDRMFLSYQYTSPLGETETIRQQLVRQRR
jgi:hypothetical protein